MNYKKIMQGIVLVGLLHNSAEAINEDLGRNLNTLQSTLETFRSALPTRDAIKAIFDNIIETNFKLQDDFASGIKRFMDALSRYENTNSDYVLYEAWLYYAGLQDFYNNVQGKNQIEILKIYNDEMKNLGEEPVDKFADVLDGITQMLARYDEVKRELPDQAMANQLWSNILQWLSDQKGLDFYVDWSLATLYNLVNTFDDKGNLLGIRRTLGVNEPRGVYGKKDFELFQTSLDTAEKRDGSEMGKIKIYKEWKPIIENLVGKPLGTHVDNLPQLPLNLTVDELDNLLVQQYTRFKRNKSAWYAVSGQKDNTLQLIVDYFNQIPPGYTPQGFHDISLWYNELRNHQ